MKIKLNKEISQGLKVFKLRTVDVILFLISKGFETKKEPFSTSLQELTFENKKVKKCFFDTCENTIIIKF